MSRLYYFASDSALAEQPNPYIELLSVNEALARGVEVDRSIFREDFDCDAPGVILYCESEDAFDHPNIYLIEPDEYYEDIGTARAHRAVLEWDWDDRARGAGLYRGTVGNGGRARIVERLAGAG